MFSAQKSGNRPSSQSLSSISNFIFKAIYLFISLFIFIGEVTKKIILSPWYIGRFILLLGEKTISSFDKIKLPSIPSIQIPSVRLPSFKLPAVRFPSISFPAIRVPSIKFPKLKFPRVRFPERKPQPVSEQRLRFRPFKSFSVKLRYFILGSLATLIITFFYQSYAFVRALPSPNSIGKVNYPLSTHILDRNGKLLYEIYREQNRTPVHLTDLPPYVYQAAIAIEDKDFYKHNGISLFSGILRAIKEMIFQGQLQGGSTITQQLVKSALLTPERTFNRKIKEMILAVWTEQLFNKNQILEMYLNQVAYGGSSYGIEEAAKIFFGKHARELTLSEAALLAGLPQAPSFYSPYTNPTQAKWRRDDVLDKMAKLKYVNDAEKRKAQDESINIIPLKTNIRAPHFVFYTKSFLEQRYGIRQVEEGGLKVTTTLDLDVQNEAEKILREELDKLKGLQVTNGAIVITRPSTGEILAMVGSVDYFTDTSGAFNVTTALRQPGSSIKPLMYSLALQKGFTAASILDDSPVVFRTVGSSEVYSPVNYDGKFHGKLPLRYALANSYNIPAVKTLNTIGVVNFIDHATKMGIGTWIDPTRYGLSLTLGGGEVTMLNMAEAFGVFANSGYRVDLDGVMKLDDSTGNSIYQLRPFKYKILDEGISYVISDILSDNFARQFAFGPHSFLEVPGYKVAVKTGTTNDKKDNWTIGYTPDFLVAVWVGNNDGTPMNPILTSGITGAAPIWNRTMSYLLKNYGDGNKWFNKPDDIVEKTCYYGRTEYFVKGTENTSNCKESLGGPTPTPTH